MSIIKLTQDLENFKWTDYSKVGTPQSFYDGHSSIVTGQKTFERPNPKSLDQMISKFGPLNTQLNDRGPYGVTDYMDGTKQGQGFTPPGGPPLGFTVDMGPSLYTIGDPLTLTLTPLSYTIAGINSVLSYGVVPEQTININPSAEGAWGNFNLPIETYSSRIISKNIEDILSYSLPYRSYGSEHPFIIRDIGEKWGPSGFGSGIVTAINRTDADIERIQKFFRTPQGLQFQFTQNLLQFLNPRKETRIWDESSIFTSLIPMFHAQRHLTFSPGTYEDAIGKNKGEKSILSGYGKSLTGRYWGLTFLTTSKRLTIAHLLGQVPSTGGKMEIPGRVELELGKEGNLISLSKDKLKVSGQRHTGLKTPYIIIPGITNIPNPFMLGQNQDGSYGTGHDHYFGKETRDKKDPLYYRQREILGTISRHFSKISGTTVLDQNWQFDISLGIVKETDIFQGDRYGDTDTTDANYTDLGVQYWSDHGSPTVPLHPLKGKERALGHSSIPKAKQKIIFINGKSPIKNLYTTKLGDIGEVQVIFPTEYNVLTKSKKMDFTTLAQYYANSVNDPKPSWSSHQKKEFISTKYTELKITSAYQPSGSLWTSFRDKDASSPKELGDLIDYSWKFFVPDLVKDPKIKIDDYKDQTFTISDKSSTSKLVSNVELQLIKKYSTLAYGKLGSDDVRYSSQLSNDVFVGSPSELAESNTVTEESSDEIKNIISGRNDARQGGLKKTNDIGQQGKGYLMDSDGNLIFNDGFWDDTTTGAGLGLIKRGVEGKYANQLTDKINIHPYGKDLPNDVSDFIKFKFKDLVNDKFIIFRAILSGISDSITPEWSSEKYIGRPDKVHVYQGTERAISFTFNVYPKTKQEFPVLMEKLNYLIGLCYPTYTSGNRMISPFIELTLGDMFNKTPGFLSSLTIEVDDNSTWEIDEGLQFPKYITCGCEFTYIGKYLPSSLGKHYELNWLNDQGWSGGSDTGEGATYGTFNASLESEGGNFPIKSNPTRGEPMKKLFEELGS